jgi:hypothetical protein
MRIEMAEDEPALTVAQVRKLLQVVPPKREYDVAGVIAEIARIERQNWTAFLSHRKRHLQILKKPKSK